MCAQYCTEHYSRTKYMMRWTQYERQASQASSMRVEESERSTLSVAAAVAVEFRRSGSDDDEIEAD